MARIFSESAQAFPDRMQMTANSLKPYVIPVMISRMKRMKLLTLCLIPGTETGKNKVK
jgi:hypothetical protein